MEKIPSTYGTQISEYINTYYHQPLRLEEVASHFHLNKCYFCTILKKETGKTFSQLLNEARINKSKELLCTSQLSILDIALAVGFNNQNYFNITFKKLTGITPIRYRQLNQI